MVGSGIGPGSPGPGVRRALVIGDGSSIVAQSGGITIESHPTGTYGLNFGSSVDGRAIAATLQDQPSGGSAIGATICGGTAGLDCPIAINDANHVLATSLR